MLLTQHVSCSSRIFNQLSSYFHFLHVSEVDCIYKYVCVLCVIEQCTRSYHTYCGVIVLRRTYTYFKKSIVTKLDVGEAYVLAILYMSQSRFVHNLLSLFAIKHGINSSSMLFSIPCNQTHI